MKKLFRRAVPAVAAVMVTFTFSAASASSSSDYESQVIAQTNEQRVAHDKVKVRAQACADKWAEGQARWMANNSTLQHRSGRLAKVLKDCHFTSASENIAFGFPTALKTVLAWMASPGHRTNLLRSKSRYIGVGAVQDDRGVWWVAQVFGSR